jgi:large subunit ribosomal protein L3
MPLGVIARKIGMSRVFLPTGEQVAVTYLKVQDNTIVRTKTKEKDGYDAVVLGVDEDVMKTRKGKELKSMRNQKEFQVEKLDNLAKGGTVDLSVAPEGSLVTITGVGKGKGFQGVMKRWHFAGGPATHGSHFKREPGSVGMRTWPGRIHAGKKMAGRMGGATVTIKNRPVVVSDTKEKVMGIKGAVPGPNGSLVYVTVQTGHTGVNPLKAAAAKAAPAKKK